MATPYDNPSQSVKRIQLPSGKTIEVVFFDRVAADPENPTVRVEPPRSPARERMLHVCPDCAAELVYPTQWEEAGPQNWFVSLRCPACEWTESAVFAQKIVDRFDEELDRATEALMRDLEQLTRANMAEEIERFSSALASDAIVPFDF